MIQQQCVLCKAAARATCSFCRRRAGKDVKELSSAPRFHISGLLEVSLPHAAMTLRLGTARIDAFAGIQRSEMIDVVASSGASLQTCSIFSSFSASSDILSLQYRVTRCSFQVFCTAVPSDSRLRPLWRGTGFCVKFYLLKSSRTFRR